MSEITKSYMYIPADVGLTTTSYISLRMDYYMPHTFAVSSVRQDAKENVESYNQHKEEDTVAKVDPEYREPTVYATKDTGAKRNIYH